MTDTLFKMDEFEKLSNNRDKLEYIWDHTVKYIDVTDGPIEAEETLELDINRHVTIYARRTDLDTFGNVDDEEFWIAATYRFEFEEE